MDIREMLENLEWPEGQLSSCNFDIEHHTAVLVADYYKTETQYTRYTITCRGLRYFWISRPRLFTFDLIELTDLTATRIEIEDEDESTVPLWELTADFRGPPEGLKLVCAEVGVSDPMLREKPQKSNSP